MLHLGYEVWVEDEGGRRIPEYKVQTEGEDGKTIAAYIPSESGKVCPLRLLNCAVLGPGTHTDPPPLSRGSENLQTCGALTRPRPFLPQRFVIRWKDHHGPTGHYTSMRVSVDGAPAGKTHMSPGGAGKRVGVSTESASSYRPFQFADLQTTGASSFLTPPSCG